MAAPPPAMAALPPAMAPPPPATAAAIVSAIPWWPCLRASDSAVTPTRAVATPGLAPRRKSSETKAAWPRDAAHMSNVRPSKSPPTAGRLIAPGSASKARQRPPTLPSCAIWARAAAEGSEAAVPPLCFLGLLVPPAVSAPMLAEGPSESSRPRFTCMPPPPLPPVCA